MAKLLIGFGVVLVVFTFLLAFTIYGEIAAVLGVVLIVTGALMLGRSASSRGPQANEGHY